MTTPVFTQVPVTLTTFAQPSLLATPTIVIGSLVSPHVDALADSSLIIAHVEAGAEAPYTELLVDSTISFTAEIEHLSTSQTGGFMLGTRASLSIETTLLPEVSDHIRPLLSTTVVMQRPSIVDGRPVTPRAVGRIGGGPRIVSPGVVLGRISPYSVNHQYPNVYGTGQPKYRWLSIDAQRDPDTDELTSWPEANGGPAWSTPGAFRPTVTDYRMVTDPRHRPLDYPAVVFDSSRLDHLNVVLPEPDSSPTGPDGEGFTWIIVGAFTRFRGMLRDSCPILDFTADAAIDYSNERVADRSNLPDWFDTDDGSKPSIYTGWTAYTDNAPELSMLAYRQGPTNRSARTMPYADNQVVVMAITQAGLDSFVQVTSLLGTGQASGQQLAMTPREIFDAVTNPAPNGFTLGKGRFAPPFDGLFGTGSMSLLEVGFYNYALGYVETGQVANYLAGVYGPASLLEPRVQGPQNWGATLREEIVFTTNTPTSPYYLLHGGQADKIDQPTLEALIAAGVRVVVTNYDDYAKQIAAFGNED